MDVILSISCVANGIMLGCIGIMYKGIKDLDTELHITKQFAATMIEFTEEQTGLSNKALQDQFNTYIDKRARSNRNG